MNDITFLVPVFNLEGDRLNNFKYVAAKLRETNTPILVIEQVRPFAGRSNIIDFCKALGIRYHSEVIDGEDIHKSFLINRGSKLINTEYVWMNDADCVMDFKCVLSYPITTDFVQPYKIAKKITKRETILILSNNLVDIEFGDESDIFNKSDLEPYISLPFALSFIYKKSAFFEMGGLNERFIGWGFEDNEFTTRLFSMNSYPDLDIKDVYAVHLYHPINISRAKSSYNKLLYTTMVGEDNIERAKSRHLSYVLRKSCNVLTLFRGNYEYLNNVDIFLNEEVASLENIKITWVVNTTDSAFIADVYNRSKKYKDIRIIISDESRPTLTSNYYDKRHEYVTSIYRRVLPSIADDFIVTLEDDMIPPKNAIVKLYYKMSEDGRIGAVAGIYNSKDNPKLACCVVTGCSDRLPTSFITGSGMVRGERTGGGFTIWNNSLLKELHPIKFKRINENTVEGWDWVLSKKIIESDYKIFLDTDLVCEHLDAVY